MKYLFVLFSLTLLQITVEAQEGDDQNIFTQSKVSFVTENEMANYLKNKKPSAYLYYQKLSGLNQSKVFRRHQSNKDKDLTEIILTIYRQR